MLESVIQSNLIDSLIQNSNIKRFLYPPKSPKIQLEKKAIAYRGNLNSNTTVLLVSDFDCGKCIDFHPIYDSIYNSYKNKVRFGYVDFSSEPSPLIIASKGMNNQNKFWEFYDIVFNISTMIDSSKIFRIADSLQLDMNKFTSDFNSKEITEQITNDFSFISNSGIYATPTIIVNNRLIFNSGSYEEIARLIDIELED